MTIPKDPGSPGDTKDLKDDVVGILSNGVLLDSHKQTWSYDNCNGHSDKKGQYHYHIPPKCFVESSEVSDFAETEDWWISDDLSEVRAYDDMAAQFPPEGSPSPVAGWARDGFPIYVLYDENGNLQRGMDFGGSVDEEHGKTDSKGNYGYFITADPPFAPPCLRGDVGLFTYFSTKKSCPKDGITNTILDKSEFAKCIDLSEEPPTAEVRSGTTPFESVRGCDPSQFETESETDAAPGCFDAAVSSMVAMGAFLYQHLA